MTACVQYLLVLVCAGYPIVSLFFDAHEIDPDSKAVATGRLGEPTPGRVGVSPTGLRYQVHDVLQMSC